MTFLGIGAPAYKTVEAKTAAYTIDPTVDPSGKVFTTRGATTAITFTLPAVSGNAGLHYFFASVADVNMVVAGPDEGVVSLNDLTADSVAYQTASLKIGGAFLAVCDGTSWLIWALPATVTQTVTVASA